jgi:hypothetical protein
MAFLIAKRVADLVSPAGKVCCLRLRQRAFHRVESGVLSPPQNAGDLRLQLDKKSTNKFVPATLKLAF